MIIRNIMKNHGANLVTIKPESDLKQAASILNEKKIGALPVVDNDGSLVGIISERDIVRICASDNQNPLTSLVKDAMTRKLETAAPSDSIDIALARMTDRRIRHLPVLDDGKLVGIVSIGDLVKSQIDNVLKEADAMRAYIHS